MTTTRTARCLAVVGLAASLTVSTLMPAVAARMSPDTTGPRLVGLSFAPGVVDVADGPATLFLNVRAVDDGSGLASVEASFYSRSTGSYVTSGSAVAPDIGARDAGIEIRVPVPVNSPAGLIAPIDVVLRDVAGNETSHYAELDSLGFDVSATVIGPGQVDTAGPLVVSSAVSADTVDVRNGSRTLTHTVRATDDLSGLDQVSSSFRAPSGQQALVATTVERPAGELAGTYVLTTTVPDWVRPGSWTLSSIDLRDKAGNYTSIDDGRLEPAGFAASFPVLSDPDLTPPTLVSARVGPTAVDTSRGPAVVTATLRITDDRAGLDSVTAQLFNSGFRGGSIELALEPSGTPLDQTRTYTVSLPQGAPEGDWVLTGITLYDRARNMREYRTAELDAAGVDTTVTVAVGAPTAFPAAPSAVVAVAGVGSARVSWRPPSEPGSGPVTGYILRTYVNGNRQGPGTFVAGTGTSRTVDGLTNGSPHRFSVTAVNAAGVGLESRLSSVPVIPGVTPPAPQDVTVAPGVGSATVSWRRPPLNGQARITAYVVTPYIGGVPGTPVRFDSSAIRQRVAGLADGVATRFTVAAVNAAGTGRESPRSAAVTPRATPDAPTRVVARAGIGSATLTWRRPAFYGASRITAYLVTPVVDGVAGTPVSYGPSTTWRRIGDLRSGATYVFLVQAVNAAGAGPPSVSPAVLVR